MLACFLVALLVHAAASWGYWDYDYYDNKCGGRLNEVALKRNRYIHGTWQACGQSCECEHYPHCFGSDPPEPICGYKVCVCIAGYWRHQGKCISTKQCQEIRGDTPTGYPQQTTTSPRYPDTNTITSQPTFTTAPPHGCPTDCAGIGKESDQWKRIGPFCYFVDPTAQSVDNDPFKSEALHICKDRSETSRLPQFNSLEELDEFFSNLSQLGLNDTIEFWLGVLKVGTDLQDPKFGGWSVLTHFNDFKGSGPGQAWNSGGPDQDLDSCARQRSGFINDDTCDAHYRVVCQTDCVGCEPCPPSEYAGKKHFWIRIGDQCYVNTGYTGNWDETQKKCAKLGGHPPAWANETQFKVWITSNLQKLISPLEDSGSFFTAARQKATGSGTKKRNYEWNLKNKHFEWWATGDEHPKAWRPGQPNRADSDFCVRVDGESRKFTDVDCDYDYMVVCQKQAEECSKKP